MQFTEPKFCISSEKIKTFNDFIFLLHNIASAILNNKKLEL